MESGFNIAELGVEIGLVVVYVLVSVWLYPSIECRGGGVLLVSLDISGYRPNMYTCRVIWKASNSLVHSSSSDSINTVYLEIHSETVEVDIDVGVGGGTDADTPGPLLSPDSELT